MTNSAAPLSSQPGSPLVALTTEQYTDLQAELADAQAERAELALKLEERDAELASLRDTGALLDKALGEGLLIRLDERYSKLTGPLPVPPKQAA